MTHTMVTYTVKPGREHENAALVRAVFEELAQTRPAGFRYAVFQLPDSRQFVHLYTTKGAAARIGHVGKSGVSGDLCKDRPERRSDRRDSSGGANELVGNQSPPIDSMRSKRQLDRNAPANRLLADAL